MRFKNLNDLAKALEERAEALRKKEYETTEEEKEIKEKLNIDPGAGVDNDSVDKLFAEIDEVKKAIAETKELAAETVETPPVVDDTEEKMEFEHLGEFFKLGRSYFVDRKMTPKWEAHLKTTGYLEEGQSSMGGALVPEQFYPQLLAVEIQRAVIRPLAWKIPTRVKSFSIPRVVDTDHSSNVYGGVTGYWTAEGGTLTESNPAFGEVNLSAKKLTMYVHCSNELLEDNAVGLEAVLRRLFGEGLAWFEDKGFTKGSGVNEPLGLTQSGSIDNINTTASHFYIEDAATMFSNMLPGSYKTAVWLMSPSVIPELLTMESLGNSENMWFKGALRIKDAPGPWTLFGRPIYFTEFCAALGTSTDVMFVDPSYYIVLDRQGLVFEASPHPKFASDRTTYRLKTRTDGQCWMNSTLTLADGSTTVSPVVNSHHA